MKRTISSIIIIVVCVLLFAQCKRKKGEYLGTISFTEQDLQIVPYLGGESFTLVDSLADSIHYHIQYPRYLGTYEAINPDHHLNTQDDIVYEDYFIVEEAQVMAPGDQLSSWINFSTPFKDPLIKYVTLNLSISSHPEINYFEGSCKFDNGNLYQYGDALLYYDSLTLVGRKFYFVYGLSSHSYNTGNTYDSITDVFYTIEQGIVGLKTSKKHTWRLK
jgi:hypothetical protein